MSVIMKLFNGRRLSMKTVIALTGADGNMGREVTRELLNIDGVTVRALVLDTARGRKFIRKEKKLGGDRFEAVIGNIADITKCLELVKGADYVINCAAVIPPRSDKQPEKAVECNLDGVVALLDAIKRQEKEPRLIHISTVALYGNRSYLHPWGRVGDPLLPSVYDVYAASKLKGERLVLESGLKYWAVLRQTAMLHERMLMDNISDGLMFHTCFNTPLEWSTAQDSGLLIRRIIERDLKDENEKFWRRVFNIGGGADSRKTGYDTFEEGFALIGGSAEKFMKPGWNTIRNFHGMWFYDGQELEEMFSYQRQNFSDYWKWILKTHGYYKLGKIVPPSILRRIVIQRLLKDNNAPQRWIADGDRGKVKAYFGSEENVLNRPKNWSEYYVIAKGRVADGDLDYENLRDIDKVKENGLLLSHGYDETKPENELDLDDMKKAAAYRGGKCLSESMVKGDLYTPLLWECCDGHKFSATPYTVLKAGHWCAECQPGVWDYDRLAKKMPFYAQIWYDSHARGENYRYFYTADYEARFEKTAE